MEELTIDEQGRQKVFKKQTNIVLFHFIIEIPYVIFAIIMAVMSQSLIMMMESVHTTITLIHTGSILVTAKKLQQNSLFRYDYGMGKIEAFGAFLSGIFLYIGFTLIVGSSIMHFIHPVKPHDILGYAIVMKVVALLIAGKFYLYHKKLYKQTGSKVISSGLVLGKVGFLFEAISLIILIISFGLRDLEIIVYFEPAACILLAMFLMLKERKQMMEAIGDLLDRTAGEEVQQKVLKCVAPVFNDFEEFRGIRTRQSGEIIYIDLLIGFSPDKPYAEIEKLLEIFSESVNKELPGGKVSIVLQKY